MVGAKSGTWIYPVICFFFLLASLEVDALGVPMTLLHSAVAKGAVCLDGSPPAYHFSPGSGSGANNWLVHMEGGGWCRNVEECLERKNNFRGSSNHMKPLSFSGILGKSKKYNPDFYNWNRVKIRYCDGSSFTGDVERVDPATNLHYRGARVWLAIMEDLLAKGMNKAENALLSGCSAGGLASILHCDKFRSLLPASAKVKCFSDAGYFIDGKDITGTTSIRSLYNDVVNLHGSGKNLPSSCTSSLSPSLCFFPQNVVPKMSTPLFILNAAYDAWQIKNTLAPSSADPHKSWNACKLNITSCSSDQLEKMQDFRSEFLRALPASGNSSTGMFIISCYAHCQSGSRDIWSGTDSPMIDKMSIAKAVGDWYSGRSVVRKIDCPYPCNSSCRNRIDE
ncbi:pectin acetylesterase 8-like [Musa acuminata AAA Group]|uniref:Pectin acetylesterase n=1 Tax=Musa acuminata subsp. malaccensis TaxID=214687 RepID=A0A804IRA5_MUSAM|nr:PREDICTED: pectin acetylesterase 8-like [Musa acuminata subsp. malaccensis]CAG1842700.1 unnamed protein product [Musa acuminata subsp. malaccensis]